MNSMSNDHTIPNVFEIAPISGGLSAPPNMSINARFLTRPISGVERVALELTKALREIASERGVFSLSGSIPRASSSDAITLLDIPLQRGHLPGQIWEQIELPIFKRNSWIINLCNTAPMLKRKQIIFIHDAQYITNKSAYRILFRIWYSIMQPIAARRANLVFTVSDYSRNQLEKFKIVPKGKCKIIHNGGDHIIRVPINDTVLSRFNLEKDKYILALASNSPHKNIQTLVRSAERRRPGSPKIIVAGGGGGKAFAEANAMESEHVEFIGRVTDGELRALYENAIAFAFPSITEGFGLPPLEAMMCGCPVVVSDGGAIPEVCGDAAIYVSPLDVDGWTDALERVADSVSERQAMRERGLAQAKSYTWRRAAENLITAISEHVSEAAK